MGIILKLITLALAILAILVWLKIFRFKDLQQKVQAKTSARKIGASAQSVDSCAYCGVFIPRDSVFRGDHGVYCSQEHCNKAEQKAEMSE